MKNNPANPKILLILLLLLMVFGACSGGELPVSESAVEQRGDASSTDSPGQDAPQRDTQESVLPDTMEPAREQTGEPSMEPGSTPDEPPPAPDHAAPDSTTPDGSVAPDASEPVTREIRPEPVPERVQETQPDQGASLRANAVSLLASFLQNHPQSGLMERVGQSMKWQLVLVVPAGNHQLRFRLDNKAPDYGTTPGSSSQWPVQGQLQASGAGFSMSLLQPGRYRFEVDLSQSRFAIHQVEQPTAVRLEGSWNGKPNQTHNLTRQNDGTYQADLMLQKGSMRWHFGLQRSGGWVTYGVLYQPRGVLPQGGFVQPNGKESIADIARDSMIRVIYRPLEQTYTLRPTPIDGAQRYQTLLSDLSNLSSSAAKNARIDQFLQGMQYAGRLPWVQGHKVIFAVRWKQAKPPVYLSGTFNQWSTSTQQMKQVTGTDFYHLEVTLPTGRHAYKFADSSSITQWIEDPANSAFEYGPFGTNSVVSTEGSSEGELHQHQGFFATQLNNRRTIYVYLPPEYYKNLKWRYPVLYMHDGQNLFDPKAIHGGWDVNGWVKQLTGSGKMQPVIVVGVANTSGRFDEYTHTQDKISGQLVGGKASAYADFLLREVKPWLDGRYRTLPSRRNTSTMGSSLGGLISLWLGYQHTDAFFRIGALSSTYGWGKLGASNPTLLDIVQQEHPRNIVIYTDSGSPSDNYQVTLKMRDLLQQKGYVFSLNLQHWVEQGAQHNEKEWRTRLFRPLAFLLGWR